MKSGKNWFGLALILGILSLVEMLFMDYAGHHFYAIMAAMWGLASLSLGIFVELKNK